MDRGPGLTRKVLPPCSIAGCADAAAAVMDGRLLCGAHAADKLRARQAGKAVPITLRPAAG